MTTTDRNKHRASGFGCSLYGLLDAHFRACFCVLSYSFLLILMNLTSVVSSRWKIATSFFAFLRFVSCVVSIVVCLLVV